MRNGKFNYEAAAKNFAKGVIIAKRSSKPVRCIETGKVYPSTREAGRSLGIPNNNISYCCRGKQHTAGGFHFEYIDQKS